MIKMFSAEDVLSLPQFEGYNVFELIKKENDQVVADLLYPVGADNKKDVEVYPCRHRKVDGTTTVNYVYVFFERTDKEWLSSAYSTMSARIDAVKDGALKAELLRMSQDSCAMKFKEEELAGEGMRDIIVDTHKDDTSLIKSLKYAMKAIR